MEVEIVSATTTAGKNPTTPQTATYTGFDKVSIVMQGNDSICYSYGYDQQRIFMEEHVGNATRTKRYVGNCEYITETNGNITDTQWLTYLSGPTGVYAVVLTKSGSDQIFYVLKDNLGSWTTITDETGFVEQRLSYDAWGNLRNPNTWSGSFNDTPLFDRGFTGHEHLYNFGLINMNGRMYDPLVSSFLSVDQYVQSPDNAQGFNRYAYCMNNPLKYIDPSGWRFIGGMVGYTPNSSANTFDPYVFYGGHIPLEPRDICDVGVRTEVATAVLKSYMYGNHLKVGGLASFGDDGKIIDINVNHRVCFIMKIYHIYTIFISSNTNSNHKNTIMMKQITLLFLLLTVNVSFCQKHSNYYLESSEKGFVCINDDTLSFRIPYGNYYYGSYSTEDSLIILGDNLLVDRNFYFEEEPCDPNVLEITCSYLERQWYMGYAGENPDTNIYMRKVDNTLHRLVVFYNDDKNFKHSINGIVSFDSIELRFLGDSLVLFLQIEGSHILTEASLPNRLGLRYSFFQKHYEMIPFLSKKRICFFDEHRIYFKKETGQIIFDFGKDWQGNYYTEYVFTPTDKKTSCIEALRKYYPDL